MPNGSKWRKYSVLGQRKVWFCRRQNIDSGYRLSLGPVFWGLLGSVNGQIDAENPALSKLLHRSADRFFSDSFGAIKWYHIDPPRHLPSWWVKYIWANQEQN